MAIPYFTFNGTDSRTYGLTLIGNQPYMRPQERVQHVTIPGRSGEVTLLEGESVYESYIRTVEFTADTAQMFYVARWLQGSGILTFSNWPKLSQQARVIGAYTMERLSRNLERYRGAVQFYCEPLLSNSDITDSVTLSGSGATHSVNNPGITPTRPRIEVTVGEATWWPDFVVNGSHFTVQLSRVSGASVTSLVIDSEAGTVVSADGTINLLPYSTGEFPVLARGTNTIVTRNMYQAVLSRRVKYL